MKKKLILSITALVLALFIGISVTRAWYVNRYKVNSIDASTKDISFVYKINNSKDLNVNKYEISNIAFFDIDNEAELDYFMHMVTHITITIENTSDDPIEFELEFSSELKNIKDKDGNVISTSYVDCIILENELSIGDEAVIIADIIPEQKSISGELEGYVENTTTQNSKVLHLYLFGVQSIDTANNNFLKESHSFSIKITAN